jgi:hypothetical protein
MDQQHEQRIRERAYQLWEKEGSPDGRDQEFWERARLMVEAERAGPIKTPLGSRTEAERKTDEVVAQSFPASDPPASVPSTGARTG